MMGAALLLSATTEVVAQRLPTFTRGVYILLADKGMAVKEPKGVESTTGVWSPKFSNWVKNFNVVFFTFINYDMRVPPGFEDATKNRARNFAPGTKILYSIAGDGYSKKINEWKKTFSNPVKLAEQVSKWKSDGIDIDFETGVGADAEFSKNLVKFVQELRKRRPDFIISMAV
jgi:chitinase